MNLSQVPGDAWLDSEQRVRRLSFSLSIAANGDAVVERVTLTFNRFGAPVSVAAPQGSSVVPFSADPDVFSQLGGNS